jgi:GNAT superfamily N-acetyltransferase
VTGLADVTVRAATIEELPDVLNVIDGAALETDTGRLRGAIDRGDVLVAVADGERVLGALVLDEEEITAVAVRRRRRGQGIGTALVEAAAANRPRLVAEFDPRVRPFWERVRFEIAPVEGVSASAGGAVRRLRGVREPSPDA